MIHLNLSAMRKSQKGYTIIEILIVLAIVGMIILIVLLTLPALKRTYRNNARKQAVDYVLAQMNEYYSENSTYPLSTNQPCSAVPACVQFQDDLQNGGVTKMFDVVYNNYASPHEYPFSVGNPVTPSDAYDKVVIIPSHWCNRSAGIKVGDANYPVSTSAGGDTDFRQFSVYTPIENNTAYCLDVRH